VLDLSHSVALSSSGALTVHFFLTDGNGNGVNVFQDAYELRLYVSELMPANSNTGAGPTWDQLIAERGTPAVPGSEMPGNLSLVDAGTGEYNYTADARLAPSSNVTRVTLRARWRETIDGTRIDFALPVNASYDFLQSDPGTKLASSGADMVTTKACEACHGARIGNVGHGGGYTQVKTCNQCHNANYMASRDPAADLGPMIHSIHSGKDFSLGDFSEITYPQDINTCTTCHSSDAPQANLAFTDPSARNCGSCHGNLALNAEGNGLAGGGHNGGAQADNTCTLCHQQGGGLGGGVVPVHNPAASVANTSEFDVGISMTPPANGSYYVAGEAPVVTVTLTPADGGPAVNYTAPRDSSTNSRNGLLRTANLFVYGPRTHAVPVLTTNSTTDPALSGSPTQGHALYGGGSDPRVVSNSSSFRYQLMDVGNVAAGTYMVRVEAQDYGANSATDYVTSSNGVINFQVGTADVQHKLSGDACAGCHGDTIMHLEGAHPHHVNFDTDQCLACHDFSGNHGDYIGNRVHAVHRASISGDLNTRDWHEVTFPQPANNCTACHTDPNPANPVWRRPNAVACGGCHGSQTDLATALAAFPEVVGNQALMDQLTAEVAAANHMLVMGGDYDPTTNPQPQCPVCHGEGRIADLYETHHLVSFPPPAPDPNE
jgi:OmcA/MtrC family decaheme c-type cytochrome